MPLREEFETSGQWLFRWRSYLPLVVLSLIPLAVLPLGPIHASPLAHNIWELACLGIGLSGLWIRALVIGYAAQGTSGRNVEQQEAKVLNVSGMYSVVRHPLYLGNYLMWLGPILVMRSFWAALVMTLVFWIYYERIMFTEEEFLRRKFGAAYEKWASVRPAIVPGKWKWVRPQLEFSWRNVLRREYSGLFGLIAAWEVADWVDDIAAFHTTWPDALTIVVFAIGAVAYVTLRAMKKSSKLLHIEDR
jgi:protein-S-isoprenylcysteine O-methyltransferase Ste14